jgi:hypothetical protein
MIPVTNAATQKYSKISLRTLAMTRHPLNTNLDQKVTAKC